MTWSWLRRLRDPDPSRRGERGQGIVEFAVITPVMMLILLGMLEFGFMFDNSVNLGYATREGARMGAALVNGGGTLGCASGESPNASEVDGRVVAAVQRILVAPGTPLKVPQVVNIRIYKATSTGAEPTGVGAKVNVWTYSVAGTTTVDGQVSFVESSHGWDTCTRSYLPTQICGVPGDPLYPYCPPDSIGVGLEYTYNFTTPFGGILKFFGGSGASTMPISDKTVMAMNPAR